MRYIRLKDAFNKSKTKILVRNINDENEKNLPPRHSALLPNTIRALIVGPSKCGKTNIMLSLIESPNELKFENVYIFSKSFYQHKYEYLEKLIKPIKGMGYHTFSHNEGVLDPNEAKNNSIMIFDDVACEKQDLIFVWVDIKISTLFIYVKRIVIYLNI